MMLIQGRLSPGAPSDADLQRLSEALPEQLAHPCPLELVLAAAGGFCQRVEADALGLALTLEERRELLAFCRPEALSAKLERELGDAPFALRRIDYRQPHFEAWRALGLVLHVTPGNAPLLPFLAVLESLLVGNCNWLRPSSADQGLSVRLLAALLECDASGRLAGQVAVLPVAHERLPLLMAQADAVSAWGGDLALQRLRDQLPPGCRWIDWGQRISFAYLVPRAVDEPVLDTLADEICRYAQQACSSPQGVWVDSDDPRVLRELGAALAQALARRAPLWPAPAPSQPEAADISTWQAFAQLDQVFGSIEGQVWSDRSWRVVWQHQERFEPGPLFRSVSVRPLPRARLAACLRPWRRYLQSCGLAAPAADQIELGAALLDAGVGRIVPLTCMHQAYEGAPHDGVYALTRLARRVSQTLPQGALSGLATLDLPRAAPPGLDRLEPMDKSAFLRGLKPGAQLFFKSGGSSGAPKLAGFSYRDYHRQMRAAADGLFAAGLDPARDRVLNLLYAGHLYGGLLSFFTVLDKLKATHYPMGGPSGDDFSEIAQVIVEQRIDTLIGMPGTVFQLFQREEARLRAYGGVKKVMLGGEHLGAGQRRWLRDCGVSTIRSAIYGTVDAGPLGHACAASPDGVFHLMSATQWLEIVDLEQDTPVARGERGRMLFTSLAREGHRVERYEVGDLGRWVDGACACGNRAPRFELLERHGAMLRVGTAFLRPNELARHAGAPIQMIVDYADAGHERLRVYVEADAAAVEACLRADADIQEAFECTLFELQVESRPQTEFQRNAIGKVPLVLDERLRAREAR